MLRLKKEMEEGEEIESQKINHGPVNWILGD